MTSNDIANSLIHRNTVGDTSLCTLHTRLRMIDPARRRVATARDVTSEHRDVTSAGSRMTPRLMRATAGLLLLGMCVLVLPSRGLGACELPVEWRGEWFQSDKAHLGPVVISKNNFSSTGLCMEVGKSNRYLIKEEGVINQEKFSCYKCMVINMKHHNVIQYKESYCDPLNQNLRSLCFGITGDAMLFSMFRLSAAPISCPFRGPLTFTYSRNLQECSHPVSQVDSCADDSRLLLRFQACADVPGSESFEEELVCLGSWEEGVNHYLVGKINHTHANSDNDRYRCFIYERAVNPEVPASTTIYLAQSADATCQGLISAYEGGKTMKLTKAIQGGRKCKLPWWFTAHNHWHTLDYSQSYYIYHHNTSLRISNGTSAPSDPEVRGHTDLRLVCYELTPEGRKHGSRRPNNQVTLYTDSRDYLDDDFAAWSSEGDDATRPASEELPQREEEEEEVKRAEALQHWKTHAKKSITIIVHVTVGCRTGYWCMRVHRRASHVVQVERGELAYRAEEACTAHYWTPGSGSLTTLVARGEHSKSCGPLGRYLVGVDTVRTESRHVARTLDCDANTMPSYSRLNVGCTAHDTLELEASCPMDDVTTYQCHGRWDSDGVTYVVASPTSRPSGAPRRVCFAYSVVGGSEDASVPSLVTVTARHDTCSPLTRDAHLTLNATLAGPCAEASSIASSAPASALQLVRLLCCSLLVAVLLRCRQHTC